jgi:phenylpyruvate tautomerase PptA (4-oxalocrotonate tautomerase family)
MPYLSIQTNQKVDDSTGRELMRKASQAVSEILGKSENYVMVAMPQTVPLIFAGSDEPAAYLELKSIGLPTDATAKISQSLCALISAGLDVPQERIYIEFANAERSMWGWNGKTF